MKYTLRHNLIDLHNRAIYPAEITVVEGRIADIVRLEESVEGYILPGFVDSHIHVESSMLTPAAFARMAVVHGTVATVSDPHEIANVLGLEGIDFMIHSASHVPLHIHYGAPSCVPATEFETAGATLNSTDVAALLDRQEIGYLSEMMNWPGVLNRDPEVMAKIQAAHERGKPVDGHAPGLKGEQATRYIEAGIQTDHECFSAAEARDKLQAGMKVLIREGSAAKNYVALAPLITEFPEQLMFCSDDKHPDDLRDGHINDLVKRALSDGYELFDVLRMACVNPVEHYELPTGLLRVSDPADFIVVTDLESFNVQATYLRGECVARDRSCLFSVPEEQPVNRFVSYPIAPSDFEVAASKTPTRVIRALDGELITEETHVSLPTLDGKRLCDISQDVLKIAVVNRYEQRSPAVAFIQGFGLKSGALAGSVAHDSHNIVAIGVDDTSLARAVQAVQEAQGGLAVVTDSAVHTLPLPVAGLMSTEPGEQVAAHYEELVAISRSLGSQLHSPFMTLSFMALLVIPQLKLSDRGLFDGSKFTFVSLDASD